MHIVLYILLVFNHIETSVEEGILRERTLVQSRPINASAIVALLCVDWVVEDVKETHLIPCSDAAVHHAVLLHGVIYTLAHYSVILLHLQRLVQIDSGLEVVIKSFDMSKLDNIFVLDGTLVPWTRHATCI